MALDGGKLAECRAGAPGCTGMRWSVLIVMLVAAGTARADAEHRPRILKLPLDARIMLRFDDTVVPTPAIPPRVAVAPLESVDALPYPRGMVLTTPPIPHRAIAVFLDTSSTSITPITDDARGNVLGGIGVALLAFGAWLASRRRDAAHPVAML